MSRLVLGDSLDLKIVWWFLRTFALADKTWKVQEKKLFDSTCGWTLNCLLFNWHLRKINDGNLHAMQTTYFLLSPELLWCLSFAFQLKFDSIITANARALHQLHDRSFLFREWLIHPKHKRKKAIVSGFVGSLTLWLSFNLGCRRFDLASVLKIIRLI